MIPGIVFLTLASDEGFFVPEYDVIAKDDVFLLEYCATETYEEDEFEGRRRERLVFLSAVNPNLKGLRDFVRSLYDLVSVSDKKRFGERVADDFTFFVEIHSINYLRAIGLDSRHYGLFFSKAVFSDFKDKYVSYEWRGQDGVDRMFKYVPKEVIKAAFSNGYSVFLDDDMFEKVLGKATYMEIVRKMKEEEIDLSKGTYWLDKENLLKLFDDGRVWLPYFWSNAFVPEKIKKYPYSYLSPPKFLPPPITVLIVWNSKENRWELKSVAYGWVEIPD